MGWATTDDEREALRATFDAPRCAGELWWSALFFRVFKYMLIELNVNDGVAAPTQQRQPV